MALAETVTPIVSVCIVTYNSAQDIGDCLHAVRKQSFPLQSIVVVDNASTDGTREVLARYGDEIRLIANERNNGFAGGQNQALAAAAPSDYVLVLNPDVSLDPDYIAEIIAVMERDPRIGSATGMLVRADRPDTMDSAGLMLRPDRNAVDLAAGEPAANWTSPREIFGVSGAAAVYRRAMIEEIADEGQFFDEDFFAYKEDVDVAWRARHLGWTSAYVPAARAVHRRGWKEGGRRSVPLFVRRHSYQNRFFTLIKNEPAGWHLLRLIPRLLLVEAAKLGYIVLFEPGLLACWPRIAKLLPAMLRKRRRLFARAKAKRGDI
ncbi:putative glycosyltransferase [Thermobacillus composti KWC4]|uniref:Putative glycosyltransferase n=1 Tax=Thermobacillus composti (strain DSM 18247 / JCM 13945 / KWC4) TaxID=717605 RepID=L0EK72_THECK|nr:glycosyltransferase family 2 protein [Thermobacillus composti]AGA59912.1 putative glycosyltransferase [Thermobacillus composti KWC4]